MLAVAPATYGQQAAPATGEEVYIDRVGCWNCHGLVDIAEGARAGLGSDKTNIRESKLPLRRFVGYTRLPSGEMPPIGANLASDAELAEVYRYVGGVEPFGSLPITVSLNASAGRSSAQRQEDAGSEVELRLFRAGTAKQPVGPDAASLRYRVTILPEIFTVSVADRPGEYQLPGRKEWVKFTTDQSGEALLSSEQGFIPAVALETDKKVAATRLRMRLPAGRYVLVVEAVDYTNPAQPVVVGIGTAVLSV